MPYDNRIKIRKIKNTLWEITNGTNFLWNFKSFGRVLWRTSAVAG